MLPQSNAFSHGLSLNNVSNVWLIGNLSDQVLLFRYINQDDKFYPLVVGRKLLGGIK